MASNKMNALDSVMCSLLSSGIPMDIGIPSWLLTEMITRETSPLTPQDVMGQRENFKDENLLLEYRDKVGYQFTWGTMSEKLCICEDEEIPMGTFELFPKDVLKAFPQPALLEDLFMWMYQNHPHYDDKFECQESYGDWFVMAFCASGEKQIDDLRRWLALVFIPRILPDLMSEAMRIVDATKSAESKSSPDGSFNRALIEIRRGQLCCDPSELRFLAKQLAS